MKRLLPPVYVLNYDHFGVILWGTDSIHSVLHEELERLKKYSNFSVGWDSEAFTYDYLFKESPELLKKMQEAIKFFPKRLNIGSSTYGQPLSRFINEESNIRQLTYALEVIENHFGLSKKTYLMSEHAFHCQMPQLLKKAGFQGAVLRTHFMMYGCTPTINEPIVNWIGLDGTPIPAVPMYQRQAQAVSDINSNEFPLGAVTLDGFILTDYNRTDSLQVFREKFGETIHPLVASRADDPRQREEIIEAHNEDDNFIWLSADTLFDHLPDPAIALETKPGDFSVRMPWGYCGNWIWNKSREAEVKVLTAERLNAIARVIHGTDMSDVLDKAWKALLVGQHHDIQIVGLENAARQFLGQSISFSEKVLTEQFDRITEDSDSETKEKYVFNPLSWARTARVRQGKQVMTLTIPALGFKNVLSATMSDNDSFCSCNDKRSLKTPYYEVVFDLDGCINKLNTVDGTPLFKTDKKNGCLSGLIHGQECQSQASRFKIQNQGGNVDVFQEGLIGPLPYRSQWTFYEESREIDLKVSLTVNEEKIGQISSDETDSISAFQHEDKLCLRLFPDVQKQVLGIADQPFAVSETKDRYLQGNYWNAVTDGNIGLAVFNKGLMCSVLDSHGRVSIPLAYSMYYVWNTVMLKGTYDYELSILPFRGNWKHHDLHRKALEYNFPCVSFEAASLRSTTANSFNPFQDLSGDAILSALFTDGSNTYARFYEYQGQKTEVSFKWMGQPACFEEVDFRLKPVCKLGSVLPLSPWQVRTVKIVEPVFGRQYPVEHHVHYDRKKHIDWKESNWFKDEASGMTGEFNW